ncbi:MAG: hypothetical protein CL942_14410 [Desulfovibrio sp.]|nr:hypothetical protein [Desulfovibrio sp.]MBC18231.1 hypothetical protein [Desulfovibrio sp.]|tara:strand:- start:751 stop:1158 length:408 start_codon:yes stop_codon:yes gene_type:complete
MSKHIAMELNCPGWIQKLIENKDEIQAKQAIRKEFEKHVEELELPLTEQTIGESHLHGDCREFRRLSLFVKYHSTYHVRRGGCGLCSKHHWLATWCILPDHHAEEIEIAELVAKDFDRRYPHLGIFSMPHEWWQI